MLASDWKVLFNTTCGCKKLDLTSDIVVQRFLQYDSNGARLIQVNMMKTHLVDESVSQNAFVREIRMTRFGIFTLQRILG